MKSIICVIGSTGFIGKNLIEYLELNNLEYISISRSQPHRDLSVCLQHFCTEVANLDLSSIEYYFREYSVSVINLLGAGVKPESRGWDECFKTNVIDFSKILIDLSEMGAKRLINVGSAFEYGNVFNLESYPNASVIPLPNSAYSCTKAYGPLVLSYISSVRNIFACHIRPCVVYGKYEESYRLFQCILKASEEGCDVNLTSGEQIRGFIPVSNLISTIVENLDYDTPVFKIINLPGSIMSVREFVEKMWIEYGCRGTPHFNALSSRGDEPINTSYELSSFP